MPVSGFEARGSAAGMRRFLKKKAALAFGGLLIVTAAYLCWWPVPVEPVSWQAPEAPGYVGPHARNSRLAEFTLVDLNGDTGPEHILFGDDGRLYTGVDGGTILRMEPDGGAQEVFANTGGRALGMDFDAAGNLIVADALKGLLSVDPAGNVSVLNTEVAGTAIGFADAVVVADSGRIYVSDATQRFPPSRWNDAGMTEQAAALDILENSCTGRILEYDPQSRATRVVADGFSFANGVALSGDQHSLFVAETGRYRIWRIPVDGDALDVRDSHPGVDVLLENLPGFPDNLMRGDDGRIWVGFAGPRMPMLDKLSARPFWRKLIVRLPGFLRSSGRGFGHIMAFTEEGDIVRDLQDPDGSFPTTTGATEYGNRLYLHTLNDLGLAWVSQ